MKYIKPLRIFEDTGYVNPEYSYYVPLDNVMNRHKQDMKTMVDDGRYFSIFAPRQSGKTTFFKIFSKSLETNINYIFILLSFENCRDYSLEKFYHHIQEELSEQLLDRLDTIKCKQLIEVKQFLNKISLIDSFSFYTLFKELNKIITQKKIIIFIDEFDGIPLNEISNFLTTIRKLYQKYKDKKEKALYSVGLIGIRNITKLTFNGVSPFNIADHVKLPPFSFNNIMDLYKQYTNETNQPFTNDAVQKVFKETNGQPWLVNRLGNILTTLIKHETIEPITAENVEQAVNILLKEKNDHFTNLNDKIKNYKESYKKICLKQVYFDPDDEAQSWLCQYGLVKEQNNYAVIANPIYKKRFSNIENERIIMPGQQKKIFISYSHKDKYFLDKLIVYLDILKINNIDYWYDENIRTGDEWSAKIESAIETSHLTICLLSNNFLSSSFIQKREFPAIKDRKKEGMIIFPVLVKDCLWQYIDWFKNIQVYPKDGISFENLNEKEQEKKMEQIIQEILEIFK